MLEHLKSKIRMTIAVNFPIKAIGKKKPEKMKASTGFEFRSSNIWIISYIIHITLEVYNLTGSIDAIRNIQIKKKKI